uniref:Putative secreted protein n=1 Tax=Ixodes ricinus TaxID=34613 RepID=A0A6B0U9L6_IXORI
MVRLVRVVIRNDVGRTWISPLLHVALVTKVALACAVVAVAFLNWPRLERRSHDRTVLCCTVVSLPGSGQS